MVTAGEQLVLPDLTVGAEAGFFAPQQPLTFFLAVQQLVLPVLVVGADAAVFAVQVDAIAWLETTAAAVTTDAPTICFRVLVRDVDFM